MHSYYSDVNVYVTLLIKYCFGFCVIPLDEFQKLNFYSVFIREGSQQIHPVEWVTENGVRNNYPESADNLGITTDTRTGEKCVRREKAKNRPSPPDTYSTRDQYTVQ